MAQVPVGINYPLRVVLADGNSSQYPQAKVFDPTNTLVATVNLTYQSGGIYAVDYAFPSTGYYSVVYTVFSDSAHTTPNPAYSVVEEPVQVTSPAGDLAAIANAVWDALLADHQNPDSIGQALLVIRGLLQYNYILDQTDYNTKGLLVAGRIRIFPSKADTDAGTNAIATLTIEGTAEAPPDNNLGQILKVTAA